MTIVRTELGTRESAEDIRFYPASGVTATDVQDAIEQVAITASGGSNETAVSTTPYNVLPSDVFLAVDTSAGAIDIVIPAPAAREGIPLVIKDVTGNAATNNITISGQTIDGIASPNYKVASDFGGVRLRPRTADYTVSP